MAQQTINVGSAINDGTGDPARTAFTKSNANFTELYTKAAAVAATWTTWTPTVTSSSGALTSYTVNVARYAQAGKTITAYFDITITNVGTGAASLIVTLPVVVSASGGGVAIGREIAVAGYTIINVIVPSSTFVSLVKYDGSAIIGAGAQYVGIAIYEGA